MATLMVPMTDHGRGYQEGRTGNMPRDAGWGVAQKEPKHYWESFVWYDELDQPHTGMRLRQLGHRKG